MDVSKSCFNTIQLRSLSSNRLGFNSELPPNHFARSIIAQMISIAVEARPSMTDVVKALENVRNDENLASDQKMQTTNASNESVLKKLNEITSEEDSGFVSPNAGNEAEINRSFKTLLDQFKNKFSASGMSERTVSGQKVETKDKDKTGGESLNILVYFIFILNC